MNLTKYLDNLDSDVLDVRIFKDGVNINELPLGSIHFDSVTIKEVFESKVINNNRKLRILTIHVE